MLVPVRFETIEDREHLSSLPGALFEGRARPHQPFAPYSLTLNACEQDGSVYIALWRGLCPTGGYRLNIGEIWLSEDLSRLTVLVDLVDPPPDAVVTMVAVQPSVFARICGHALPQTQLDLVAMDDRGAILAEAHLDLTRSRA